MTHSKNTSGVPNQSYIRQELGGHTPRSHLTLIEELKGLTQTTTHFLSLSPNGFLTPQGSYLSNSKPATTSDCIEHSRHHDHWDLTGKAHLFSPVTFFVWKKITPGVSFAGDQLRGIHMGSALQQRFRRDAHTEQQRGSFCSFVWLGEVASGYVHRARKSMGLQSEALG